MHRSQPPRSGFHGDWAPTPAPHSLHVLTVPQRPGSMEQGQSDPPTWKAGLASQSSSSCKIRPLAAPQGSCRYSPCPGPLSASLVSQEPPAHTVYPGLGCSGHSGLCHRVDPLVQYRVCAPDGQRLRWPGYREPPRPHPLGPQSGRPPGPTPVTLPTRWLLAFARAPGR